MAKPLKRFLTSLLGEDGQTIKQQGETVYLTPDETHHMRNVLHMKEGNLCLLFDGEGNHFLSRIERFLPDGRSQARLLEAVSASGQAEIGTERPALLHLSVAQALPQDGKMNQIVRMSAELGVFELIPLVTERTVVRVGEKQFEKVRARWNRILEQTLKQSRVCRTPAISALTHFDRLCSRFAQYDQIFLLHPSPESIPLRSVFIKTEGKSAPARILLVIGPEGGFSAREVKKALGAGAQVVRMGSGILKTDTAFVAAASFFSIMYT